MYVSPISALMSVKEVKKKKGMAGKRELGSATFIHNFDFVGLSIFTLLNIGNLV